ncbi:MAG: hypothetical protein EP330_23565 [Deltaproteobacteria bacterium]|nr:MAG: hypothetical protein EP330_23565 [Deltaproteobacteria bacterium]
MTRHLLASLALLATSAALAGIPAIADLPLPAGQASAVHLYVPGAASPDDLKIKAKGGEVRTVEVKGGGMVILGVVAEPGASELALKVKAPGAKGSLTFPTARAEGGSLAMTIEPSRLRIGRGGAVVKIEGDGLPEDANIELVASIGELGPLAKTGSGWIAPWTPPDRVNSPLPVLFVASDLSRPGSTVASTMLEIGVPEKVSVDGPMQGEVSLAIGDRSFGKQQLGQRTSTVFEIIRFPSDTKADVVATSLDDGSVEKVIDLPPSGAAQIRLAPLPKEVGWPAGDEVTVMLAAVDNAGKPLENPSAIEINAPSKVRVEPKGDGWFALHFQAPVAEEPWSLTAKLLDSITWMGGRSVPDVPRAEISLDPTPAPTGSGNAEIVIGSRSGQGQAWTGAFTAVGQGFSLAGDATTAADGATVLPVVTSGSDPLAVCAEPLLEASGLPPVRVRVWSDRNAIGNGESAFVHAIAEDALGLPVPATVELTASQGTLVPVASTDSGHTIATWSGSAAGPVELVATLGALTDRSALWVGSSAQGAAPVGTREEADGERRWRSAAPCVTVERAEATPAEPAEATDAPAE